MVRAPKAGATVQREPPTLTLTRLSASVALRRDGLSAAVPIQRPTVRHRNAIDRPLRPSAVLRRDRERGVRAYGLVRQGAATHRALHSVQASLFERRTSAR